MKPDIHPTGGEEPIEPPVASGLMPLTDLPLDVLRSYSPSLPAPSDLDAFWDATLADARGYALDARFEPVDGGLTAVRTYDLTFAGAGGDPVRGWLHLPAGADDPLPCVVQYIGYSGGRGLAHENTLWACAGYAHVVMDTRGQGWGNTVGATPDPAPSQAAYPGNMTRGITDPATYYYRRLYTDAVRCIEAARQHPAVDASRVAVTGGSQGGGLSLAAAALVPDLVAVMPDVPFLCHFRRGVDTAVNGPYPEIGHYLAAHRDQADAAFNTLSYFDGAILGRRATAPALFSIALMDSVCPPSTCFAAYHAYAAEKELRLYEFNDHEGGQGFQQVEQLRWLRARLS